MDLENFGLYMEYEIKTEGAVEIFNDNQNLLENSTSEESTLTLDSIYGNSNNPATVLNEKALKVQRTLLCCDKCSFTTLYAKNLRSHSRIHTSTKPFKCPNLGCTFMTRWAKSLRRHQRSCPHRIQIPAETSDQDAVSKIKAEGTTETLMDKGKTTEGETLFYCSICSFSSKWKPSLKVHLRVHTDHKPFCCSIEGCKYRTKWSSDLRKHYKIVHQLELLTKISLQTDENLGSQMECESKTEGAVEICNDNHNSLKNSKPEEPKFVLDSKYFNYNNPVTVQYEKVQRTLFGCDKCSFTTLYAKSLRTHCRIHTSEKPFKCPNLGCTFMTRWAKCLRNHQRPCPHRIRIPTETSDQASVSKIKTEGTTETLVEKVKTTDGETLFYCTICSFSSKYKQSLTVHLRVHTDYKPFGCPIQGCNYQTKWSSELRKHCRILQQLELPPKAAVQNEENLGSDRECKKTIEGFVSSSTIAFACILCEFIADDDLSALKHSCQHKTVVVSLNRSVPNAEAILGL